MRLSSLCAAAVTAILASSAGVAEAGTVYIGSDTNAGGYTISGSVDATFGSNTLTLVLTNTTPTTFCAQELLTAFRFGLTGVEGTASLTSASAFARNVYTDGSYSDSAAAVDLLQLSTWSLLYKNGTYDLNFNPDAEYALLGAPTGNSYADCNGSITPSPGHNPFARITATFVISFSEDVTASAALTNLNFRYGTDFAGSVTPVVVVPLPPAVLLGLGLMGGLGAVRAIRRRRQSEF